MDKDAGGHVMTEDELRLQGERNEAVRRKYTDLYSNSVVVTCSCCGGFGIHHERCILLTTPEAVRR